MFEMFKRIFLGWTSAATLSFDFRTEQGFNRTNRFPSSVLQLLYGCVSHLHSNFGVNEALDWLFFFV